MDELERLKQLISGGVTIPNSQPVAGNVNVNATNSTRPGGSLMADRVPVLKGSKKVLIANEKNKMDNDLQRLLEEAGMREANPDGSISSFEGIETSEFLEEVDAHAEAMMVNFERNALRLGGEFRAPGIMHRVKQIIRNYLN